MPTRNALLILLAVCCSAAGCRNASPVRSLFSGMAADIVADTAREQSLRESHPAYGPPVDPNERWANYGK